MKINPKVWILILCGLVFAFPVNAIFYYQNPSLCSEDPGDYYIYDFFSAAGINTSYWVDNGGNKNIANGALYFTGPDSNGRNIGSNIETEAGGQLPLSDITIEMGVRANYEGTYGGNWIGTDIGSCTGSTNGTGCYFAYGPLSVSNNFAGNFNRVAWNSGDWEDWGQHHGGDDQWANVSMYIENSTRVKLYNSTGDLVGISDYVTGNAADGWSGRFGIQAYHSTLTIYVDYVLVYDGDGCPLKEEPNVMDVTTRDNFNKALINATVTVSNSTFTNISNTTNGQITFYISDDIYNITINGTNYAPQKLLNWNSTDDIAANLTYYKARFYQDSKLRRISDGVAINNWNFTFYNINTSAIELETNTTNSVLTAELSWNQSYNLTLDSTGYQIKYLLFNTSNMNDFTLGYNITFYTQNSFYFEFIDEITEKRLYNCTLDLISNIYSNNYTTSNGTIFIDLLTPDIYTIRYDSTDHSKDYYERFYYYNLTSRSFSNVTLYLVNKSASEVTATVYDESSNEAEDVYIKVLKYDLASNSYVTKEVVKTDFAGEAVLHLIKSKEFYKFMMYKPFSTFRKITSPAYITSDSLSLQINLGGEVGDVYYTAMDTTISLTYNNESDNFRFTYSDPQNTVTQGCLEVYKLTTSGETFYDSSCSNSDSSSLLVSAPEANNTEYLAKAYLTIDGTKFLIDSEGYVYTDDNVGSDNGLLLITILVLLFASIGFYNLSFALIITPLPLIFGNILNIIDIPIGVTIPLEIICIITAIIISKK